MFTCELIIKNISQLVTPLSADDKEKKGQNPGVLKIFSPAEIGVFQGKIVYAGAQGGELRLIDGGRIVDAGRLIALPAFVDPHTHLCFSGYRADEFHLRLRGTSYLEILRRGGGILSTVKKVRECSFDELLQETRIHLQTLVSSGTTSVEVKSGYGLNLESEIKMLEVVKALQAEGLARLVPTFMGLHSLPWEYQGKTTEYVNYMTEEVLPVVVERKLAEFVDVFVEKGAFTPAEALPFLEKSRSLGLKIRLHADEFSDIGALPLACKVGAISAEHLLMSSDESLELLTKHGVMAVLLPGTVFSLGLTEFPQYRRFQQAGLKVALGSDYNPGTSMAESMELIISLATTRMKMPVEEALLAATLNAARSLGLEGEVGSLEAGKNADIILLDLPDYRHLGYRQGISHVKQVFYAGKLVAANS